MTERIKVLKYNIGGKFMYISACLYAFLTLVFGILMMLSPSLLTASEIFANKFQPPGINEMGETVLGIFLKHGDIIQIKPGIITMVIIPSIVGGVFFVTLLTLAIVKTIGYKAVDNKGIRQIVKPIKLYNAGIATSWISFVFVTIAIFIGVLSIMPALTFKPIGLNLETFNIGIISGMDVTPSGGNQSLMLEMLSKKYMAFWPYAWMFAGRPDQLSGAWVVINWLMPSMIFFPFIIMALIGLMIGDISWSRINLLVLANIGDQAALEKLNENRSEDNLIEAPSLEVASMAGITINNETRQVVVKEKPEKEKKIKEKRIKTKKQKSDINIFKPGSPQEQKAIVESTINQFNGLDKNLDDTVLNTQDINFVEGVNVTLKSKCQSFFKNNIKMMELSENTSNGLYRKFKITYDALINNKVDNKLEEIAKGVEEYIEFSTSIDKQFVELMARLSAHSRQIFEPYASEMDDLISNYFNSLKAWNLYEAEVFIEQMFAIASKNDELLAKVGYCVKHRLANHFHYIDIKMNGIQRLNVARDSQNYDAYRQSCMQIIKMMSPNKLMITNFQREVLLS